MRSGRPRRPSPFARSAPFALARPSLSPGIIENPFSSRLSRSPALLARRLVSRTISSSAYARGFSPRRCRDVYICVYVLRTGRSYGGKGVSFGDDPVRKPHTSTFQSQERETSVIREPSCALVNGRESGRRGSFRTQNTIEKSRQYCVSVGRWVVCNV